MSSCTFPSQPFCRCLCLPRVCRTFKDKILPELGATAGAQITSKTDVIVLAYTTRDPNWDSSNKGKAFTKHWKTVKVCNWLELLQTNQTLEDEEMNEPQGRYRPKAAGLRVR